MNDIKLNIWQKEKDSEELFIEIEKINKSNQSFNLNEIKNSFNKIKNDYIWRYKNISFAKEKEKECFRTIVNEISQTTFNKNDFYIS